MLTPKEALAKDGTVPVKQGKGRLSKAADARCRELAANGWSIKGYTVGPSTDTAPVVTKDKATNGVKEIADLPPVRYDENVYKAVSQTPVFGKTEFGMREVCGNCRCSLAYHLCDAPVILGVLVDVVPR